MTMKNPFLSGIAILLAGGLLGGGFVALMHRHEPSANPEKAPAAVRYTCPMHPQIIRDQPGDCPICGMSLVPLKSETGGDRKIAFYRSPMDPRQTSPTPRKDEMGMDYVAVYEDEQEGGAVEGLAPVRLDAERRQMLGVRTVQVVEGLLGGEIRATGRVVADETRVRKVNVKLEGFVEKLFVDSMGQKVSKGQPLFRLYSPELLSAQNEFLLALKTKAALGPSPSGTELVESARKRLRLWDIPEAAIMELERSGTPTKSISIPSPVAGVVTMKSVVEGSRISSMEAPFEITDLSSVWVVADIYEAELSQVRVGMAAALTLAAFPGRSFQGRVHFLEPVLDPKTRTAKVRIAFANPAGELRPELFGDVLLKSATRKGLLVPSDAVLDAGLRKVVFVEESENRFVPREVKVGAASGALVEILSGLEKGESVASGAAFLLDSESRLRSAAAPGK
ncbi:MAG: efflux RND transporter periplasmic adaptor subunit [Holophagaceae bacterium]|nr:efflux RND transporter periplasmic adaptor subunit [Holophagaceae bacterium]